MFPAPPADSHDMLRREINREIAGLSTDSTVALRKVQGVLRDNWATAVDAPIRINHGPAKRWATPSPSRQNGMTVKSDGQTRRSNPGISQAPVAGEEILGLDDIFTGPVTEIFAEKPHYQTKPVSSRDASDRVTAPIASAEPAPGPEDNTPRFDEALLRKVRWASPEKPHSDDLAKVSETTETQHIHSFVASQQIRDEAEVIRRFLPVPSSQFKGETDSRQPREVDTAPNGDNDAHVQENMNDMPGLIAQDRQSVEDSAGISGETSHTVLQGELVEEYETAKTVEPLHNQPVRERLKLDDDLREDLSTFDYMIRNNRILSHSIANLVDRYFYQASQEEEESYY
ncbi:MAG TPA: hypothetical protein V6C52_03190 [Coleofasciculaceae cyanobacterium]